MSEFIYTFHKYPVDPGEIHKDILKSDLASIVLHVDADDEDKPANVSVFLTSSLTESQLVALLGIVNTSSSIPSLSLPIGTRIFNPSIQEDRFWQKHFGNVSFSEKLDFVPSSISVSNVVFDGLANLNIVEITNAGFEFSVVSLGQSKRWGCCQVYFDWEAVL